MQPSPLQSNESEELFFHGIGRSFIRVASIDNGNSPKEIRFAASSGTREASEVVDAAVAYRAGARIPRLPWRRLSDGEIRVLQVEVSKATQHDIKIFQLLDLDDLQRIRPGINSLWLTPRTDPAVWRHPLTNAILNGIRLKCRIEGAPEFMGLTHDPAGLLTVSREPGETEYVGLHVDTLTCRTLEERAQAPMRLCVNLGVESRHFLFINLTVKQMRDSLLEKHKNEYDGAQSIAAAFMKEFPLYPVIRLLLRPGEAYIAPTENMIHDGSSGDVKQRAYHLALRGHFSFYK